MPQLLHTRGDLLPNRRYRVIAARDHRSKRGVYLPEITGKIFRVERSLGYSRSYGVSGTIWHRGCVLAGTRDVGEKRYTVGFELRLHLMKEKLVCNCSRLKFPHRGTIECSSGSASE